VDKVGGISCMTGISRAAAVVPELH
jgi:hypothetical protein